MLIICARWMERFLLPPWFVWPFSSAFNTAIIDSIQRVVHRVSLLVDAAHFVIVEYALSGETSSSNCASISHVAALACRIARPRYQIDWLGVLGAAMTCIFVIALIIFQCRRMLKALQHRLEVRRAERERAAIEVHDNLLQDIQGLIMHFQAVAERMPTGDPVRTHIDQVLDRAEGVLVEGRHRVRDLQAHGHDTEDLVAAFASLGQEFEGDWPGRSRVVSVGDKRRIDPAVREAVYLVGREALLNAFQHARAAEIDMEIAFDAEQLRICVRDNGVGLDPQIAGAASRTGRWGLVGMKEWANCIGGKLVISTRSGIGTKIELTVPAKVAYGPVRLLRGVWLKRWSGFGR